MKQKYRFTCCLCGGLKYLEAFLKNHAIDRILIQSFIGRRKMRYDYCNDADVLNRYHSLIVERLEQLYFRLTGISIPQLIEDAKTPRPSQASVIPAVVNPASTPVTVHPTPVPVTMRPNMQIAVKPNAIPPTIPYKVVIE